MQLTELRLENFKCFKKPQTFKFPKLTILTGANSSGKSAVINAILGALQSEHFPYEYATNGEFVNMGDFKDIANGRDQRKKVKIGLTISDTVYDNEEDINAFAIHPDTNDVLRIDTIWEGMSPNGLPELSSLLGQMSEGTIKLIKQDDEHRISIKDQTGSLLEDFSTSLSGREKFLKPAVFNITSRVEMLFNSVKEDMLSIGAFRLPPERTYLERPSASKIDTDGRGYLDQIIYWQTRKPEKYEQLVQIMRDLALLENISSKRLNGGGRFEMLVQPKKDSPLSSLADVGFGISQFLPIIVADLQLSDNSKLFVAEPEIHLHPNVQALFGEYLVKSANTTQKTYTIETHSEYLLNRLRLAIVKGELKPDDLKVYFLENKGNDTEVFDIAFTKTGQILHAPDNFFQTYLMDTMNIALNAYAE